MNATVLLLPAVDRDIEVAARDAVKHSRPVMVFRASGGHVGTVFPAFVGGGGGNGEVPDKNGHLKACPTCNGKGTRV